MRTRHHPLKWPLSVSLALLLFFGAVFCIPPEWIHFVFSPLNTIENQAHESPAPWLSILPPLTIEMLPEKKVLEDDKPPPQDSPSIEDPGWWTEAWKIQAVKETRGLLVHAPSDSVAVVLEALGVGLDFTRKALPDSLLAHQLMLLKIEDEFAFDELKPYLRALTMARALMDKKSRESAMYDEHLGSTIMVPD